MPRKKRPRPLRKSGALSSEEKVAIRQLIERGCSLDEIVEGVNRNKEVILKYTKGLGVDIKDKNQEVERLSFKRRLQGKHYWSDVKRQFNEESGELQYFVESWTEYMIQFGEEVTHSEEMDIKDIITVDILINRSMEERQLAIDHIKRLQEEVQKLYDKDDPEDIGRIQDLEEQINIVRSSLGQYTDEYTKLLDRKAKLNTALKATRDQRVKKIEDPATTFSTYIKYLEEEEVRLRTGEQIELMKAAKDKAKKKLEQLHIYADGKGDLPFLTPESYEKFSQLQEKKDEPQLEEILEVKNEDSIDNGSDGAGGSDHEPISP